MRRLLMESEPLTKMRATFEGGAAGGIGQRLSSLKAGNTGVEYTIEVGTGTVEVITGPFKDLHSLNQVHGTLQTPQYLCLCASG